MIYPEGRAYGGNPVAGNERRLSSRNFRTCIWKGLQDLDWDFDVMGPTVVMLSEVMLHHASAY
jgi:hypothetical protein